MSRENQPAKSYDLNMLASVLGRAQVHRLTPETQSQIVTATDEVVSILEDKTKPPVPHTEKHLVQQALKFVDKLRHMLSTPEVGRALEPAQKKKISELLASFEKAVQGMGQAQHRNLISPAEIEEMFQFYGIWETGATELESDLSRWTEMQHPIVPDALQQPVDVLETRRLIEVIKRTILATDIPLFAAVYLTQKPEDYHLFWSLTQEGSDYVTPEGYGLDTQLSFDLPHNVAHLIHLSLLREHGVYGYIDDMATRAFFEAVAVFSEMEIINKLDTDPGAIAAISAALNQDRNISENKLKAWMIADRSFEFRLRASRLLADLLAIEGASLPEIVDVVSRTVQIPRETAEAEVRKYLPWTGLGAIYTLGYRRLEQAGITSVSEVLQNKPPSTWNQFVQN